MENHREEQKAKSVLKELKLQEPENISVFPSIHCCKRLCYKHNNPLCAQRGGRAGASAGRCWWTAAGRGRLAAPPTHSSLQQTNMAAKRQQEHRRRRSYRKGFHHFLLFPSKVTFEIVMGWPRDLWQPFGLKIWDFTIFMFFNNLGKRQFVVRLSISLKICWLSKTIIFAKKPTNGNDVAVLSTSKGSLDIMGWPTDLWFSGIFFL